MPIFPRLSLISFAFHRPEVQKQLDELDAAWTDVSKAVDERDAALEEALDKSSKFQVSTLWARTTENTDWSTGPLARRFARSLALLAHLLAPHCLLCLHALLRLFACLLAYSLTREPVGK